MVAAEPRAGDWLGRYRLVEVLGRGGMGTVWLAHDPQLERDVAVKVINPALAQDEEFRARFRREAVVLSQMDSAHVVAVHDHGEQDGAPYLVTQLVRGGDLLGLLRSRGALEPSYALDLAGQVLAGLRDAHAIGVVHRDVKLSNVLLRDDGGTAYLCDFGIASSPGGELTRTGALVGSAAYMAPERHSGDGGGVPGDIYSVGCLLWNMLTGTQPYVGTDAEIAMGHLRGPIPQLPGAGEFAERLNAVLRRALAKDPRRRYSSAKAMLAELADLRALAPGALVLPDVTAVRQPLDPPPARTPLRRRLLMTTLVLALVAVAVYVGSLIGGVDMTPSVLASDSPTTPTTPTTPASTTPAAPTTSAAPSQTPTPSPTRRQPTPEPEAIAPDPVEQPTSKPSTPRKKRTKQASPTPEPTPEPVPTFRCWDGQEVVDDATCTLPTGWAGAQWVFPGVAKAPSCKAITRKATGYVEGWQCSVRKSDGTTRSLSVTRWSSAAAATKYYVASFDAKRKRVNQAWAGRDVVYGRRLGGFVGKTKVRHSDRVYAHSATNAWVFSAWATAPADVKAMFGYVKFRNPTQFRGVPLS